MDCFVIFSDKKRIWFEGAIGQPTMVKDEVVSINEQGCEELEHSYHLEQQNLMMCNILDGQLFDLYKMQSGGLYDIKNNRYYNLENLSFSHEPSNDGLTNIGSLSFVSNKKFIGCCFDQCTISATTEECEPQVICELDDPRIEYIFFDNSPTATLNLISSTTANLTFTNLTASEISQLEFAFDNCNGVMDLRISYLFFGLPTTKPIYVHAEHVQSINTTSSSFELIFEFKPSECELLNDLNCKGDPNASANCISFQNYQNLNGQFVLQDISNALLFCTNLKTTEC